MMGSWATSLEILDVSIGLALESSPVQGRPAKKGAENGGLLANPTRGTQGKERPWLMDEKSVIIIGALQASLEVEVLAEVRVQEGEPLENALRRFKRKVQTEDIIKEVKRHSYYLKPGEKRRVKAALARKRNRKKARKEQD
jgi:small subunit ribosomal protein S21